MRKLTLAETIEMLKSLDAHGDEHLSLSFGPGWVEGEIVKDEESKPKETEVADE